MPDADWWQALWPEPDRTIAALGILPGGRVVDLCCGDGLFTLPIARAASEVVAIDLDPKMLERTRARLKAAGVSNCELIEGDAEELTTLIGLPPDAVIIANTFHGVPDKARLCKAVAAVLKPGGEFMVINWHRRPREETAVLGVPRGPKTEMRMEPEEVAAIAGQADLKPSRVIELPPYHYGAIFRKPDP